ncbi:DUF4142 domain-containing protein [Gluconobacter japonicus]|uniref:DUF4142 domain-containing protein n=1 Tax=Gluconobacter japonicus TaxID=376620 RepID=UPI0039E76D71
MRATARFAAFASLSLFAGLAACNAPDAPPAPALPSAASTYTLSTADAAFLQQVDAMDLTQISIANLAATHSNSDVVKAFAATVVSDHTTNRKAVAKIAKDSHLTVMDKLNAGDEAHVATFGHLYGTSFDRVFLSEIKSVQTPALTSALTTATQSGGTADIKTLAGDTTKMLQDHTTRAGDLSGAKTIKGHHHHFGRH